MAALLFRDFSFDAPSSSARPGQERAVSPTSSLPCPPTHPARLPTPPPTYSVGDLAQSLVQQSLHVDVAHANSFPTHHGLITPPSQDDAFPVESRSCYSRIESTALRMQRQVQTRLQCTSSHVKDISTLVQRMIDSEDQCNVCEPKSPSSSISSSTTDEDEGVNMDYSPPSPTDVPYHTLKFRRSTDRIPGCTTVTKSIRMRKPSRVTKRASR